ncbi:MAG: MASE3 domain-containing protein, partial [Syntrophales bacterium]
MEKRSAGSVGAIEVTLGVIALVGLYIVSRASYPVFHMLAELFSIVIGFGLFMLIWNSRRFIDNNYLVFISIAYLFISGLDLIHALAYKGMDVFAGYGANLPTQLWIAARYAESLSLLTAPFFINRRLRTNAVLTGFAALFSLLLAAIFSGFFPDCYVDGRGLTPFKIASEYVISAILLCSLILLLRKREGFDREVLVLITLSIVCTIGSELAFTFYIGVYDFSNLVGHYLKIISFYLMYKAVIETGLTKPYNVMFRNLKQNEKALERERDRAQSYLDLVGGFMVALNADQTVAMINRRGCEILGYEAPEITGKKWFDTFVPERMRNGAKDVFSGLMAGDVREHRVVENPVVTSSGEERIILWQNSVLREEGRITGTLSSGEDITDRKRAEEELRAHKNHLEALVYERTAELQRINERLQREIAHRTEVEKALRKSSLEIYDLYNHAPCGYHSLDEDGVFVQINDTELQWLGYAREEVIGKMKYVDLITPRGREIFSSNFKLFKAQGWIRDIEFDMVRKDGSLLPVLVSATAVTDDNGHFIMSRSTAYDITERREAEEDIRRLNEQLERRVIERTAELEAANKELEDFTYTVSHDLRAPLRAIDGFSRMLLRDAGNLSGETHRRLNTIRTSVLKMGQLIDDLLAFSRLGRTSMSLSSVDMEDLVKETWNDLCAPDDGNRKELRVSPLPRAFGDRTLVRQVLSNLLSNAVKYSQSKGHAVIEVGGEENGGETLYYVKDNGVGFDMSYYDKLFGVFQRLHSDEEFEGTGV